MSSSIDQTCSVTAFDGAESATSFGMRESVIAEPECTMRQKAEDSQLGSNPIVLT